MKIYSYIKQLHTSPKTLNLLSTRYIIALACIFFLTTSNGQSINIMPDEKNNITTHTKKIVLIGASYAASWDISNIFDFTVINKGVGGEQTHEVQARFEEDVIKIAPDKVIIWGFINDIHNSSHDSVDKKLEGSKNNIIKMINAAKNNNIEPILLTEVTIRHSDSLQSDIMNFIGNLFGKTSYQDSVNQKVLETNEWLKQYATTQNITLIDVQPLISDKNNYRVKKYATSDGTHISDVAYEVFTKQTLKQLEGKM